MNTLSRIKQLNWSKVTTLIGAVNGLLKRKATSHNPPDAVARDFGKAYEEKDWSSLKKILVSEDFARMAQYNRLNHQAMVNMALAEATNQGKVTVVDFILHNPRLMIHGGLPIASLLSQACIHGQLDMVKCFFSSEDLAQKALEKLGSLAPLAKACEKGHLDIVRFLLTDPGVKAFKKTYGGLDIEQDNVLTLACLTGGLPVVEYLLTSPEIVAAGGQHANLHAHGDKALRVACRVGNLEIVKFLLTSEKVVRHQPLDCVAALEDALQSKQEKIVNYLLLEYRMAPPTEERKILNKYPHVVQLLNTIALEAKLQEDLSHKTASAKSRNKL